MPIPPITIAALSQAITAQYGLYLSEPPLALPAGAHSVAWRITANGHAWIAKISDPRSDAFAKLEQHAQLYDFLREHRILAPQLLALNNRMLIGKLIVEHVDYPLQLMQAQPLHKIAPETAAAPTLIAAGKLAAQLHQVLASYPGRDRFILDAEKSNNEWGHNRHGLCEIIDDLPSSLAPPAASQAWLASVDRRAMQYLQQRYPNPDTLSLALLHGDLNFEHIQFLADGTPYIFDFGDMCWGPIAHELAVFLQIIYRDSSLSLTKWQVLQADILAGYCAEQPLTTHDHAMLPVLLVNRIVGQARYIIELMEEAKQIIPWSIIQRTYTLADYLIEQA